MPVGSTSQLSVQVLGFGNSGYLTPLHRLIRFLFVRPTVCLGLPSDSQSPATPLPLANTSPCRVCRGLSPPSHQRGHHSQTGCASRNAPCLAHQKKAPHVRGLQRSKVVVMVTQPGKNPVALRYLYERAETSPRGAATQFEKAHRRLPQRSLTTVTLTGQSDGY
jgi:hypothetical protein